MQTTEYAVKASSLNIGLTFFFKISFPFYISNFYNSLSEYINWMID
jgi:hypothetical protein